MKPSSLTRTICAKAKSRFLPNQESQSSYEKKHAQTPSLERSLSALTWPACVALTFIGYSGDVPGDGTPICFGHEAVGTVEAIGGKGAIDHSGNVLSIGDRLYWAPSTPCKECLACKSNDEIRCKNLGWPAPPGRPNAAGFRQYATLTKQHACFRIPSDTPASAVITFGCAMPTALRGFGTLGKVGRDVVIQGSGPVGLACTLLAKLGGAENITVIGDPSNRLEVAQRLGATEVISLSSTTVEERRSRIYNLTEGRDASEVIEAAGHPSAVPEGLNLLGMNGRYLIMGLYSGKVSVSLDPVRVNNLNLQIIGSLGIRPQDYAQTVMIATRYGNVFALESLISRTYNLEELEKAITGVARLEGIKTVIEPWPTRPHI